MSACLPACDIDGAFAEIVQLARSLGTTPGEQSAAEDGAILSVLTSLAIAMHAPEYAGHFYEHVVDLASGAGRSLADVRAAHRTMVRQLAHEHPAGGAV